MGWYGAAFGELIFNHRNKTIFTKCQSLRAKYFVRTKILSAFVKVNFNPMAGDWAFLVSGGPRLNAYQTSGFGK
ncbi:MAG: hypothetical protein LBF38_10995, partial [Deltaproteobacteria bacterium]|nr:hypothetical protein [Deltaproteobacteria bacterium]